MLVSARNGEAESHGDKANVSIFAPSGSAVGVAAGSSPTSVSAPLGKPGTLGEAFDFLIFPRTCGTPFGLIGADASAEAQVLAAVPFEGLWWR